MDGFSQDYESKMEASFETYDDTIVAAANHHQCDHIVQSVSDQVPAQEIQVQTQENHGSNTLTLQQQQQAEQTHAAAQIESKGAQRTSVRLPALLDGEYFTVTRVEDTNVTVRCQQCMKLLNGNLKSTGNFLSHVKRLHPNSMGKIRCKSSQRKAAVYVDSALPDKVTCPEIVREKRVSPQSKKRCKTEECAIVNEEPYEQPQQQQQQQQQQPPDWNASLIRGSEEAESADSALKISHNNSFMMEDEYDAIGRNVAAKLRNMRTDQRIIAEKLLSDVLFEAQLGNLHRDSSIHV